MKKSKLSILFLIIVFGWGCKTPVQSGYSCIDGNCTAVFENPQYLNLTDCQSVCDNTSNNTSGYNCINGKCTSVSSNAQYSTLSACQSACGNTNTSGYNCVNGNCTSVSSNAQYSTLSACQSACGNTNTSGYNCVNGNCTSVSSNAQYSTLSACQSGCSNKATITFVVYQRCAGTQPGNSSSPATFKNGAHVNLATSQSNLNSKTYFYNATTNNSGKAIISGLEPKTYYYNINGAICTSNSVRERTGSITLKAGDNGEKRIDLY